MTTFKTSEFQYKNWYAGTRKKLKEIYQDDFLLFCGLLSATSPQFSIKRNFNTANKIYQDFKRDTDDLFINNFENAKNLMLTKYKIMNCHYHNILRTLKHDFSIDLKLSGLKVDSFYQNLIGNNNAVTIDTWIARYFKHTKEWINKGDYIRYSNIIIKLAEKFKIKPCEMQAVIWIKIRLKSGFKPINFVDVI